jgi:hypothetical protein
LILSETKHGSLMEPPVHLHWYLHLSPPLFYCPERVPKSKYNLRVCLDGKRISERISLFELVVENSVRLVISQEM